MLLLHYIGERMEYDHSNFYRSSLMFCSSYVACKVFGLCNSFVGSHETPCMIIVPQRSFWMYDRKNFSLIVVKTYALTLEPRSVWELMVWGDDDDSFRSDIFLERHWRPQINLVLLFICISLSQPQFLAQMLSKFPLILFS